MDKVRATPDSQEDVGVEDGANNNYASHYPQEILDLNWQNTSEQKVKEAYKIWADTYEKWVLGSPEGSEADSPGYVGYMTCAEALNKATSEVYGENKKNLKVLDLGCGTGLVGKVLKEKFGFTDLVGLDASEEMLEIAKNRAIYDKHISTFVTNERVNDIKTGEFDAVVSAGVFTIGLVRPNAFDEVLRWIKPGGIICFNSPIFDSEEYGIKEKCASLEEIKKWKLISNTEAGYYGDKIPRGRGYKNARMLVYRILPF